MKVFTYSTDVDDGKSHTSLVVGSLTNKPDGAAMHTDENKSVQQHLPAINEVDNTESLSRTLRAEKSGVPDVQGEKMDHSSAFSSGVDANLPVTPLSHLSHMQLPSTKPRHSSASISTGKCYFGMLSYVENVPETPHYVDTLTQYINCGMFHRWRNGGFTPQF